MKNVLHVTGPLTLETVNAELLRGMAWIKQHDGIIDLQQVTRADSAGVALLIEWIRFAKQQNRSIQFEHLPEQLLTLMRVSGLDILLK
ncbi:MAG: STAS domain-containing protein [Gammaproteobacteria bacterium]